jgi:hypothetical protein
MWAKRERLVGMLCLGLWIAWQTLVLRDLGVPAWQTAVWGALGFLAVALLSMPQSKQPAGK